MYDPKLFRLDGQIAVVTGAGAGIGQAIAETFAAAGAAVVVSDLCMDRSEEVADRIRAAGGKAVPQACDVAREVDLEALVASAVEAYGKITILVNNAGGGGPRPFDMSISIVLRSRMRPDPQASGAFWINRNSPAAVAANMQTTIV